MRLLLAEDDPMIGQSIRDGLQLDGFVVDWVQDGEQAKQALFNMSGEYALLLLDLGLPRLAGLELLTLLRKSGNTIPVLILTARDALSERIAGLNSGADDYLVKPFALEELVARIHALIRRSAGRGSSDIEYGALRINPLSHEVWLRDALIDLSAREFALLHALMEQPGAVLSRPQLEERLYGWGQEVASNAIDVHLHNLRRKLGADIIFNVRGVGFKVVKP
ncbi:DNA-binding response regulator [Methylomonas sp. LW13]|uniref:Response regulator transcription factor n=1 Tax=Methylomonas aurea TaxID=2952224 RepID=A0ABT1ULB1_9GAMM|nr:MULTISPECIES: response regulator transcription factor [unclassified Methylomonas]MCQ8183010.1 response regulator transcription factor [Methylomonas sp. SURF-1]QBC25949.1 DNA-binding response regulator [Methylomonas sp. LW13]